MPVLRVISATRARPSDSSVYFSMSVIVVQGLLCTYRLAARRRDTLALAALGLLVVMLFQWLNGDLYSVAWLVWLSLGWVDRNAHLDPFESVFADSTGKGKTRAHYRMNEMIQSGAEPPEDRPRIAVVAHRVDDSGGMERVHAELVRRLLDRYRFTVVANNIADDLRGRVEWLRVPLLAKPIPLRFLLFYGLGALQLRRAHNELVHVCGALVPNRADVASVHFCHAGFVAASGRLAPEGSTVPRRLNTSLLRCLAIGAERWSYRPGRVRLLAPVSRQVADELCAAYPGVVIEETPNGVDLDRFCLDNSARRAVRAELGTDQKVKVALFVGGDWDRKGLAVVIEALAIARSSAGQLELWVLGAGDERRFGSYASAAGVGEAVRFLGRSAEPERYYQGADIFVCCSRYEPFSRAP